MQRLLNTSNENRYKQRERRGFKHVLKPYGCRLNLYDEHQFTQCLDGRSLLNMGTDIAVDLMRGLARINSSTQVRHEHTARQETTATASTPRSESQGATRGGGAL